MSASPRLGHANNNDKCRCASEQIRNPAQAIMDDGTHRGLFRIRLSAARSELLSDVPERPTAQVKHGLVFVSG
jgi:hypothetical protein